ncbi:MAG: class I tRNA ligase family protein, partial [Microcoleaceae cyanobacterium]
LKQIGLPLGEQVTQAYESLEFSSAADAILALIRSGNKFIDEQAPWTLYKQGKIAALEQVLYSVLESVRLGAYLLSPIIPNISNAIYQQLGYSIDFNDKTAVHTLANFVTHSRWGTLPPNQVLGEPKPVFRRLELPDDI